MFQERKQCCHMFVKNFRSKNAYGCSLTQIQLKDDIPRNKLKHTKCSCLRLIYSGIRQIKLTKTMHLDKTSSIQISTVPDVPFPALIMSLCFSSLKPLPLDTR